MTARVDISKSKDLVSIVLTNDSKLSNLEIGLLLKQISEDFLNENQSSSSIRIDAQRENNSNDDDPGYPVVGEVSDLPHETD